MLLKYTNPFLSLAREQCSALGQSVLLEFSCIDPIKPSLQILIL